MFVKFFIFIATATIVIMGVCVCARLLLVVNAETIKRHKTSILLKFYVNWVILVYVLWIPCMLATGCTRSSRNPFNKHFKALSHTHTQYSRASLQQHFTCSHLVLAWMFFFILSLAWFRLVRMCCARFPVRIRFGLVRFLHAFVLDH